MRKSAASIGGRIATRLLAIAVVASLLAAATACGAGTSANPGDAAARGEAVDVMGLDTLEPLRAGFEESAGKVRLVTLLSPT